MGNYNDKRENPLVIKNISSHHSSGELSSSFHFASCNSFGIIHKQYISLMSKQPLGHIGLISPAKASAFSIAKSDNDTSSLP